MRQFEISLEAWHRIYKELVFVEARLGDAALSEVQEQRAELRARAVRLRAEAELALQALTAAIEVSKKAHMRSGAVSQPGEPERRLE
jgi:hypothetical protein